LLLNGDQKASTPLSKSMISISNLYESIDQIMSFCRGKEELSSEKKAQFEIHMFIKVVVILLILNENFDVRFFAKTNIFLYRLK
jgi:hypothetical protein